MQRTILNKGFTLIELLVVISIISLISSIVLVSVKDTRAKARDAKRMMEVDTLSTALGLYFVDEERYPEQESWGCIEETIGEPGGFAEKISTYLPAIPKDPLYKPDEPEHEYCYLYKTIDGGKEYKIHVNLEKGADYEVYSSGGGGITYYGQGGIPGGGAYLTGFAWGEGIGWIHFGGTGAGGVYGVIALDSGLIDYAWGEQLGYIRMRGEEGSCIQPGGNCPLGYRYGVINDGMGKLSGYAFSERLGWIKFAADGSNYSNTSPSNYGVYMDADGNFYGFAWGENIGWIHFKNTAPFSYGVTLSQSP